MNSVLVGKSLVFISGQPTVSFLANTRTITTSEDVRMRTFSFSRSVL